MTFREQVAFIAVFKCMTRLMSAYLKKKVMQIMYILNKKLQKKVLLVTE